MDTFQNPNKTHALKYYDWEICCGICRSKASLSKFQMIAEDIASWNVDSLTRDTHGYHRNNVFEIFLIIPKYSFMFALSNYIDLATFLHKPSYILITIPFPNIFSTFLVYNRLSASSWQIFSSFTHKKKNYPTVRILLLHFIIRFYFLSFNQRKSRKLVPKFSPNLMGK